MKYLLLLLLLIPTAAAQTELITVSSNADQGPIDYTEQTSTTYQFALRANGFHLLDDGNLTNETEQTLWRAYMKMQIIPPSSIGTNKQYQVNFFYNDTQSLKIRFLYTKGAFQWTPRYEVFWNDVSICAEEPNLKDRVTRFFKLSFGDLRPPNPYATFDWDLHGKYGTSPSLQLSYGDDIYGETTCTLETPGCIPGELFESFNDPTIESTSNPAAQLVAGAESGAIVLSLAVCPFAYVYNVGSQAVLPAGNNTFGSIGGGIQAIIPSITGSPSVQAETTDDSLYTHRIWYAFDTKENRITVRDQFINASSECNLDLVVTCFNPLQLVTWVVETSQKIAETFIGTNPLLKAIYDAFAIPLKEFGGWLQLLAIVFSPSTGFIELWTVVLIYNLTLGLTFYAITGRFRHITGPAYWFLWLTTVGSFRLFKFAFITLPLAFVTAAGSIGSAFRGLFSRGKL